MAFAAQLTTLLFHDMSLFNLASVSLDAWMSGYLDVVELLNPILHTIICFIAELHASISEQGQRQNLCRI